MVKLFQLQQPKLLYLSSLNTPLAASRKEARGVQLDEVDRLPHTLKYFAALFIFSLTIVPTVFLNAVSFLWSKDDTKLARKSVNERHLSKLLRILCITIHIFQLGPIIWYIQAIISGIKFRHANDMRTKQHFYCEMVMADRDASLLRFFEAFIESMPQVLVQGYIFLGVYNELKDDQRLLFTAYFQILSLLCSLISSCWSISLQHRNLRIARPDKDNMTATETFLQFIWRFSTISARYTCLVFFAVAFHHWIFIVLCIHFFISLVHVSALQLTQIDNSSSKPGLICVGLVIVCAIIHIFTPFNMAEGPTIWRYLCGYTIEVLEAMVLIFASLLFL
uniref:XK-related protein n=1 Tax=Syphacia muris TaxID=451379 RepID=A0A0N5AXC6_9BILA